MTDSAAPRVLYSFPHAIGAAGIGTTAWQQVRALSGLGAQVTLYCTTVARALPETVTVVETLRVAGRRVPHRVLGVQRAYDYHDRRTAWAIGRARGAYDVVHAWPRACLRTFTAARRTGLISFRELPNAHTAATFAAARQADLDTGVTLPTQNSHASSIARLALEEREFAAADYLLAPSRFVLDSFVDRGFDPAVVVRHAYGHDPARFTPPAPADRPRPFTAVFVGRGEPAKGLHFALDAWLRSSASRDGRFLILGRLLPAYERALADRLADPSVEVLGFVDDVASVLAGCDVLIFPTYTEGSALVTFEAMAMGVVPLVSDAAGAPIADGIDGFRHAVGDVDALVRQLDLLTGTRGTLAAMRAAAVAASGRQTWDDGGRRLLEAYRTALASRARTGGAGHGSPAADGNSDCSR